MPTRRKSTPPKPLTTKSERVRALATHLQRRGALLASLESERPKVRRYMLKAIKSTDAFLEATLAFVRRHGVTS